MSREEGTEPGRLCMQRPAQAKGLACPLRPPLRPTTTTYSNATRPSTNGFVRRRAPGSRPRAACSIRGRSDRAPAAPPDATYVLNRDATEYDRLRAQARAWAPAPSRLFDQVALGPGARCLDAGCGPGLTMRLMAERVGPSGHVTGVDVDAGVGDEALALLLAAGYGNSSFECVDLESDEPIPGAPFDLVYARLLLFHAHDQVAMVRRLWDAVAPGGHLVLHDYDLRTSDVMPPLETMQEWKRVVMSAFSDSRRDIHAGNRLPLLLQEVGIGTA